MYYVTRSNSDGDDRFVQDSKSAMVASKKVGSSVSGEVITVSNLHGRILDRVVYVPEVKCYVRVSTSVPEDLQDFFPSFEGIFI